MYPLGRMGAELLRIRKLPKLNFFDRHETQIRVYPWDLDIFWELNNGRTLTLFDISRVALAKRCGLWDLMRKNKMGMTVAGVSMQYRKRITLWQTITVSAQCVGADDRFVYIVQNSYRNGEPCGQALLRMAFVKNGIVPPKELIEKEFGEIDIPALPDWVEGYIHAAGERPWPPNGE